MGAVILGALAACCIAVVALCTVWLQDLPDYNDASAYNYAEKTKVYANDGTTLLAEFYLENRDPIDLDEMGTYVTKGTVATEDERFYQHNGIDVLGIARAIWVNVTHTGHEGASTITQQFVRNTILADEATESTLKRKVREAYIAIKLEESYSKDEILQMYLNTINYGQGAYGIQAAAQRYYNKDAKDLSPSRSRRQLLSARPPVAYITTTPSTIEAARTVATGFSIAACFPNMIVTCSEEHDAAQAEDLNLNVPRSSTGDGMLQVQITFTSYVRETLLRRTYSTDEVFRAV